MKCPKCGFVQSDHLDSCKKCGRDLTPYKEKLGLSDAPAPVGSTLSDFSLNRPNPNQARQIQEQREQIAHERERIRAERIRLEAEREMSLRRIEEERKKNEQAIVEKEKESLQLERLKLEQEKALEQQRIEAEHVRREARRLAMERERIEQMRKEREQAERELEEEKRRQAQMQQELEAKKLEEIKEMQRQEQERLAQERKRAIEEARRIALEKEKAEQEAKRIAQEREKAQQEAQRLALERERLERERLERERLERERQEREKEQAAPPSLETAAEKESVSVPDFPMPEMPTQVESVEPSAVIIEEPTKEPTIAASTAREPDEEKSVDLVIVPKGGLIRRSLAGLIDLTLIGLAIALFIIVGRVVFSLGTPTPEGMGFKAFLLLSKPVYILAVLLATGYFSYFHGTYGQTPGKMLMGLKVVTVQGEDLDYLLSFFRFVAGAIFFLLFFMGFFWIGLDLNKQGWHDKIAQTVVIQV